MTSCNSSRLLYDVIFDIESAPYKEFINQGYCIRCIGYVGNSRAYKTGLCIGCIYTLLSDEMHEKNC